MSVHACGERFRMRAWACSAAHSSIVDLRRSPWSAATPGMRELVPLWWAQPEDWTDVRVESDVQECNEKGHLLSVLR